MSKAVNRLPHVSPTISVPPSGVMTEPFGNSRPSAATLTVPSGSTRLSDEAAGAPPPIRSKPKSPTKARPEASTTMSFINPPQTCERSAWVETAPSAATRSSTWSFIDTTSRSPSGSQPSPEGWFSTSRTTVSGPPGAIRLTVCR